MVNLHSRSQLPLDFKAVTCQDLILTIILFLSLANLGLVQISPGIFNMIEYGAVGDGITEDSKVLLLRHGKQHAGTTLEFAPS
ncbi:hypothetical protein ACOSP7_020847 [Xanthoceras sorbifolium]